MPYFPKDQMTDKSERFFVNEAVREQILKYYDKEVPYVVEVPPKNLKRKKKSLNSFGDYGGTRNAKRDFNWPKGGALKKVGVGARKKLQAFFDKKVHQSSMLKSINWRSNDDN